MVRTAKSAPYLGNVGVEAVRQSPLSPLARFYRPAAPILSPPPRCRAGSAGRQTLGEIASGFAISISLPCASACRME